MPTQLIKVTLRVPEKCTPVSCLLSIKIDNVSDLVLTLTEVARIPEAKIELKDNQGRPCLRTPKGLTYFGDTPPVGWSTLHVFLRKGEEKVWTVDLSKFFVLPVGECTLSFSIPVTVEARNNNNRPESCNIVEVKNFKFTVQSGK